MDIKIKNRYFSILSVIILCMVTLSDLKAQAPVKEKAEAKAFVQKFYDWYTVLVENYITDHKKNSGPVEVFAINQRPECFDTQLRKALIEDAFAQSKSTEIVGLDYDPFTAAQDIVLGWKAGEVKQVGNKFQVAILAAKTHIVAEVVNAGEGWKFTNFFYINPAIGSGNLLQILANIHKVREKPRSK